MAASFERVCDVLFAEQIEQQLRAAVVGEGLLGAAAAHLTSAPSAKRARPRLLLAFARLAGGSRGEEHVDERIVRAAVAVELIHTASLLHDDVVDEATERRALPSTNARFGNAAAVLAGDVVLARALSLLAFDVRAMKAAIDVVSRMSAAAMREIEVRGDVEITVKEALAIAEGKTGALFGLCGALAGLGAHAPAQLVAASTRSAAVTIEGAFVDSVAVASALERAGRAFGVAFQVADDIDDLEGDIRERGPTVPLLLGARDPAVKQALATVWSSPREPSGSAVPRDIVRAIEAGPALADARALVQEHLALARAALAPFADGPGHDDVLRFAESLGRIKTAA